MISFQKQHTESQIQAVNVLRNICNDCTDGLQWGCAFPARSLDREDTIHVKYGIFNSTDTIGRGLFTVWQGGLDGGEKNFYEWVPGEVGSRATGGKGMRDCGIHPTNFKMKKYRRVFHTERLHLDYKMCALELQGSIFQGPYSEGGTSSNMMLQGAQQVPQYFTTSSTLQSIEENNRIFFSLMMWNYHQFAVAVDMNNIFGDFAGDLRGNVDPETLKPNGDGSYSLSAAPHYDGIFKKAVQQDQASYYPMGTVIAPTPEGDGNFWTTWKGSNLQCFASIQELVDGINQFNFQHLGSDVFPYHASIIDADAGIIRIMGTDVEQEVYGQHGLAIYYCASGIFEKCAVSLDYTPEQCPMAWNQKPLLFDYNHIIDCENFYDAWLDLLKDIMKHQRKLQTSNQNFQFGASFVAIDPMMLIDRDFNEIKRMCKCDNALQQTAAIQSMLPTFVPVQVLLCTGYWFWSTYGNLVFTTNVQSNDIMPNTTFGYDAECGKIWMKNDLVAGVFIVDFNKFAANLCNSPFSRNLHPPQLPEQLPHWVNEEIRSNANYNCCSSQHVDNATGMGLNACVTKGCIYDDTGSGLQEVTLTIEDKSAITAGDSLTSTTIDIYLTDGTIVSQENTDPTGTDIQVQLTAEQYEIVAWIQYTGVFASGADIKPLMIPASDFVNDGTCLV